MLDITTWTNTFLQKLNETFNERIYFAGLQGSYARGEATDTSDIDMVVILDELSMSDINIYNQMLDTLPNRELICGFISGKNELLNWEPSDLFQFYYDTKPLIGNLDELLPLISKEAVNRAIKIGACNIYHACVHNMLYEKSDEILIGLYKSATFVIKAIQFKQTNISSTEKEILSTYTTLKNGAAIDFNKMSEKLFTWVKEIIL